jgi:hypothetical protein
VLVCLGDSSVARICALMCLCGCVLSVVSLCVVCLSVCVVVCSCLCICCMCACVFVCLCSGEPLCSCTECFAVECLYCCVCCALGLVYSRHQNYAAAVRTH